MLFSACKETEVENGGLLTVSKKGGWEESQALFVLKKDGALHRTWQRCSHAYLFSLGPTISAPFADTAGFLGAFRPSPTTTFHTCKDRKDSSRMPTSTECCPMLTMLYCNFPLTTPSRSRIERLHLKWKLVEKECGDICTYKKRYNEEGGFLRLLSPKDKVKASTVYLVKICILH